MNTTRASDIKLGIRIEVITILWMVIEMAVSIGAGIAAKSVLLTAFGLDSLIELVSGSILLWRLSVESRGGNLKSVERSERRATWVVAVTLGLLCAYVLISSVFGLLTHAKPESSFIGIVISAAALLIMPFLAVSKRRISKRINSVALAGDAANSITCATMAGIVLLGLVLHTLFGFWWAEYIAALGFLVWLIKETLEVFEEALEKDKEPAGRE
ncbi:MAG: cation transporter [Anaerolineales bacterium]|jgi:divalent metal cation (Fe/Co/Zn/Cd) transporter